MRLVIYYNNINMRSYSWSIDYAINSKLGHINITKIISLVENYVTLILQKSKFDHVDVAATKHLILRQY